MFTRLLSMMLWLSCIGWFTGLCAGVQAGTPVQMPYTLSVEAYLSLAQHHRGEEQASLLMMAAGRALYEGRIQEASRWLHTLQHLSPVQVAEKQILLAKIQLAQHHMQAAIHQLSLVKQLPQLSLFYQVQYHEILASSYEGIGRLGEALGERVLLESLLPTEMERMKNRRVLWLTLTHLPDAELKTMIEEWPASSIIKGWLKLAAIARSDDTTTLMPLLRQWQHTFPHHPALSLLSSVFLTGQQPFYPLPQQVALLLPMTGPLRGPGHAIYDGFMAAYHASPIHPLIHLYDTATQHADELYQIAVSRGDQFVIGPLSKEEVAAVMHTSHSVPTLILNETGESMDEMTYCFTLSPALEAKQIALQARQHGTQRALIIAPSGYWGDDIVSAFVTTWVQTGGHIAEDARYMPTTTWTTFLKTLLHYTESPTSTNIPPSRRQDFDMVFLVAYPSYARQIMPLLRYYYLGHTPVYAISTIYAGSENPKQDKDLEGIYFYDIPFIFSHTLPNKHWPESLNSYSRLYALGMDSYHLMMQWNALRLFPAIGLPDKGGDLYLNRAHEIVRLLILAQFQQGKAVPLSQE